MKLIDDTLKSRGKWSVGRLTMFISFVYCIISSACVAYKTGQQIDIPTNWFALIGLLYGINKTGQVAIERGRSSEQA
jgi:hypothetical protein